MAATVPVRALHGYNVLSLQDHPEGRYAVETTVISTIHASIFASFSGVTGVNR
jgi:hypothetical protein